jgi:hypothetical protein
VVDRGRILSGSSYGSRERFRSAAIASGREAVTVYRD